MKQFQVPLTDVEAWEIGQALNYPYLGYTDLSPQADDAARAAGYVFASRYMPPSMLQSDPKDGPTFHVNVPPAQGDPPVKPAISSVTIGITSVADNGTIDGGAAAATVRVSLVDTGAVAGDLVRIYDGGVQTGASYTLLADDITATYADVPTASLGIAAHVLTSRFVHSSNLSAVSAAWHITITA